MEEIVVYVAEVISLVLVLVAFAIFTILAFRARTIRSLEFQVFLFALVLTVSEVPKILDTLGIIKLESEYGGSDPIGAIGLPLHTLSMVILGAFILYRASQFLRR